CRNEWKYSADIEICLDAALPPVHCLPSEINQTVLNLIVNAAHAIKDKLGDASLEKGVIRVESHLLDDWAEIRITDSGSGIPEEIRSRIFEPFFTTKGVGKGTGQGLAIAYSAIVEKHAGQIDVESQVGVGTTFVLRIPVEAGAANEETSESLAVSA
ncbi:MAG: hypothetical protein KDA61_10810, partial [Planctomycetales bacterium]|nr:hypothetical protein [Planctomycetales bacterium]